ncbi:MAG: 2-hydroxyacyl-CoA dehydratase [Dehalococcoidales bacterium]|nr:2-hydroxyacyl-CoA dehydratase [Dehalococcoidales bacterium]
MKAFETIQHNYQQRDMAAREWKNKGGKVVGYFCNNVPDELISAAGFFPFRISGDPNISTEENNIHVIGLSPPEGFTLSMLSMLLTGKYDFLDFLVIPHARDSIHNIYPELLSTKLSNTILRLPELYFLDNLHTTFYLSQQYNRERILEFKTKLEEWSGQHISDESLSQAIAIGNKNKMLLKKVAGLRMSNPPRISGVEALQIISTSMFMLKKEHNKLLQAYLGEAEDLPSRDGVRMFVSGSPLDNLQLYEIIESCGATVVAEDNCWGNRSFDVPVNTAISPLFEAIVDRYHNKPSCSRIHPMSGRVDYCVNCAVGAKAQGAVFYSVEYDSQAWDIPDEIKTLETKGIPSLYLKKQPYLVAEIETLKANIKEFITAVQR